MIKVFLRFLSKKIGVSKIIFQEEKGNKSGEFEGLVATIL
jgi:hypothetical protein